MSDSITLSKKEAQILRMVLEDVLYFKRIDSFVIEKIIRIIHSRTDERLNYNDVWDTQLILDRVIKRDK